MIDRRAVMTRLADVVTEFRNEIDEWGEHSDEELRNKTTVDCQWFRDVWLACSDALALLKEQEPVKPFGGYGFYFCGGCKNPFNSVSQKFCSECGKAVKWHD